MSKSNLKKNNIKKKSGRAEQMAAEKEKEEKEKADQEAEQKKKQKSVMGSFSKTAFPFYGLAAALMSFLLNGIGVFSLVGIILGILGIRRNKEDRDKFFWISVVDLVISALTGILFILSLFGLAQRVV